MENMERKDGRLFYCFDYLSQTCSGNLSPKRPTRRRLSTTKDDSTATVIIVAMNGDCDNYACTYIYTINMPINLTPPSCASCVKVTQIHGDGMPRQSLNGWHMAAHMAKGCCFTNTSLKHGAALCAFALCGAGAHVTKGPGVPSTPYGWRTPCSHLSCCAVFVSCNTVQPSGKN